MPHNMWISDYWKSAYETILKIWYSATKTHANQLNLELSNIYIVAVAMVTSNIAMIIIKLQLLQEYRASEFILTISIVKSS